MSTVTRRGIARGRVQGVGYRAWVRETALHYDLAGWVRNRRDGTVEAVFSGPEESVAAVIAACHDGPGGARVEAVDVEDGDAALLAQRRPGERFSLLATV